MKYGVYSVADTLEGFGNPFLRKNDQIAIRDYGEFLKTCQNAPDMRLYKVGEFDVDSGEMHGEKPIKMLAGGGTPNEERN